MELKSYLVTFCLVWTFSYDEGQGSMLSLAAKLRSSQVSVDKAPLYKITNTLDGSVHHLLGTMHTGITIFDIPEQTYLFSVIENSTVLIGERQVGISEILGYNRNLQKKISSIHARKETMQRLLAFFNSEEKLGAQYWAKIKQMFTDNRELLNISSEELESFQQQLDKMPPAEIIGEIFSWGEKKAFKSEWFKGQQRPSMDAELFVYAFTEKNKIFALETVRETERYLLAAAKTRKVTTAKDLKELIDKGGIDYVADTLLDMRAAYIHADLEKLLDLENNIDRTNFHEDKILLDHRNKIWVEKGIIQKSCQQDEHCLIFVGAAHLTKGANSLSKLLREEGFTVEKIATP